MKNISVEETYQAWVIGYELIIKLGQALSYDHYYKGWHSANTIGVIGTAAAAVSYTHLTLPTNREV